jgi:hypothetical protein
LLLERLLRKGTEITVFGGLGVGFDPASRVGGEMTRGAGLLGFGIGSGNSLLQAVLGLI